MAAPDHLGELRQHLRAHAHVGERPPPPFAVEQTEHHALAVQRGRRGHTHVDRAILQPQTDAAILRQPTLGDVEIGHDLEPADDRRREMRRRRRRGLQHAVDAIADAQPIGERLEMHVGGARLERFENEQIHQPHHGRLVGEVHEVVERQFARQQAAVVFGEPRDQAFGRTRITRVHATDDGAKRRLGIAYERDRRPQRDAQFVEGER